MTSTSTQKINNILDNTNTETSISTETKTKTDTNTISVPKTILSEEILRPFNGNIKIHQLDVYETDEDTWQPYRSGATNLGIEEKDNKEDTETEDYGGDNEEEIETDDDSETVKLHQGEIQKTYLYNQLYEASFNRDYENRTGQGRGKLKYRKEDLPKLYKGQRLLLKTGRQPKEPIKYTKEEIQSKIDTKEKELLEQYSALRKRIIEQHNKTETDTKKDIEKAIKEAKSKGKEVEIPNFESKATIYIINNTDTEEEIKQKQELNKKGTETSTPTEEIKKQIKKQATEEIITEITGLEHSLLGWITEESFTQDGIELTLNDYGKLLEEKDKLTYENMYRSQILEEVIKTAGLIPVVNFTDLQDDVISWTSVSSGDDEEDNLSTSKTFSDCSPILDMTNNLGCKVGSYGQMPSNITSEMYAKIGKKGTNYANAVKGCKSAQEVWRKCKNGLKYCGYECTRDKCANISWNNRGSPGLNCGDSARLLKCCMDVCGIPCIMIHCPGHFYNAVKYNGKWVTADLCYVNNSRGTNQLMQL